MTHGPNAWDFAFLAFTLAMLLADVWVIPIFKRRIEADVPGARLQLYAATMGVAWFGTILVLALWIAFHRPWSLLMLGPAEPWRLSAGIALAVFYYWYMARSRRRILTKPEKFPRYRDAFDGVALLVPRTAPERRMFTAVSVTAGVSEEIVFRGFFLAFFTSLAGPVFGSLCSIMLFGLGHAYQGVKGIVRTGIAGAILTLVVLATGSLIPAMILHFTQDFMAGEILYDVFRPSPSIPSEAAL